MFAIGSVPSKLAFLSRKGWRSKENLITEIGVIAFISCPWILVEALHAGLKLRMQSKKLVAHKRIAPLRSIKLKWASNYVILWICINQILMSTDHTGEKIFTEYSESHPTINVIILWKSWAKQRNFGLVCCLHLSYIFVYIIFIKQAKEGRKAWNCLSNGGWTWPLSLFCIRKYTCGRKIHIYFAQHYMWILSPSLLDQDVLSDYQ